MDQSQRIADHQRTTPAHTPGPWRVAGKGTVRRGNTHWVANVNFFNREANARLIAAAPELLEALVDVVAALDASRGNGTYPDFKAWETAARAAIAKARGEVA